MISAHRIVDAILTRDENIDVDRAYYLVDRAVAYYSLYNPRVWSAAVELRAGVATYALPEGAYRVESIEWWPFGEDTTPRENLNQPDLVVNDPITVAGRKSLNELRERRPRITISGGTFTISPVPQEDMTVQARFVGAHVADNYVYPDIPSDDEWIIVSLALAEHLEDVAMEFSMRPTEISEGMTTISYRYNQKNISQIVDALRASVSRKYAP